MKKLLTLALTSVMMLSTVSSVFAEGVGMVDYERVVTSFTQAVSFNDDRQIRERELEKMKAEFLKELRMAKKTQADNPVAFEQLQKELQEKLTSKRNETTNWIVSRSKDLEKEISYVIDEVAKSKGIDVVVARQMVFHGGTDITMDVISQLNK